MTSHTNLQGFIAHEEAQESRSAINAESAGTRPNINVDARARRLQSSLQPALGAVARQFDRHQLQHQSVCGAVQNNADRNFTLYDQAVRPEWEFSPYLFVFSDIAFNQREYNIAGLL